MHDDLDLFGKQAQSGKPRGRKPDPPVTAAVSETGAHAPLAARMRPATLDDYVGQPHLMGPGKALRELIERDELGSLILWGPPGTGKTTLARIIAERTRSAFVQFSAVTEGVARVREIIKEAAERLSTTGQRTILFCDEIHRFNKAQQDAFLPHVEAGTISLIGATTENPSFEVIGALLSRSRVFVLQPLAAQDLRLILERALADQPRGLGALAMTAEPEALDLIALESDGDARRALNALESAAALAAETRQISAANAREALQLRFARYDKGGEEHYNLISALHKAVRGSDPDGALYWLARMLDGGEDPLYIARRIIRMAIEDIGLADPQALPLTIAARDAFQMLGSPEGELALAQAAVYLATSPKSNRLYQAMGEAAESARNTPAAPVPLHIRNAPTGLMKELGYGKGYRYAFDDDAHYMPQEYLPDQLRGQRFYQPSDYGYEKKIAERLAWWTDLKRKASTPENEDPGSNEGVSGPS